MGITPLHSLWGSCKETCITSSKQPGYSKNKHHVSLEDSWICAFSSDWPNHYMTRRAPSKWEGLMDCFYHCPFFPAISFKSKTAQCLTVSSFIFHLLLYLCTSQAMIDVFFEHDGGLTENSRLIRKFKEVFVCKPFEQLSVRKSRISTSLLLILVYIKSKSRWGIWRRHKAVND